MVVISPRSALCWSDKWLDPNPGATSLSTYSTWPNTAITADTAQRTIASPAGGIYFVRQMEGSMRSFWGAFWLASAVIGAASAHAQLPDTILYGVAYYEEYTPVDRVDEDARMMKAAGI